VFTIKSVRRYSLLCKQCVFVAACLICNKYGRYCMDVYILCMSFDLGSLVGIGLALFNLLLYLPGRTEQGNEMC